MAKITDKVNNFLFTPEKEGNNDFNNNNDVSQAHLLKVIEEVYSTDNIEVKTDLSESQIRAITKGQLFADRYNCQIMSDLCNKIMTLSISKNRLGRKEFKEISQSMQTPHEPEMQPLSIKGRLLGRE